jgi:deazaflavin-dependent oxidoreductase (nitroreductase family)
MYWLSRGRLVLARPAEGGKFGTLRLRTIGRRSENEHAVFLGYCEVGNNLVTLAMNGWGKSDPAWWLNVQAHPDVTVETIGGSRSVHARAAEGEERERLWNELRRYRGWGNDIDEFAALRSTPTAVVIFEPRP